MVTVFIYTYYPNQQKRAAINAINSKISSIGNMFSIGVGIGMGDADIVAVSEALNWASSDSSVVFITVKNEKGQEIISHNKKRIKPPAHIVTTTSDIPFFQKGKIIFYRSDITYQKQKFGYIIIGYSLKKLEYDIARLKVTTLYFCLVMFAVGVVFSIILGNMVSDNVRRMNNAVEAISSGAEHIRVDVKSKDEIGKLGNAFNNMLDRLDKSRNDLITYSEQLRKQNEELNQFSYVVSHDLKAPLRAIFKLSEWIEEDLGPNISEDSKKNMQTLRSRVFRMEGLINGLLEYAKIGRIETATELVNLPQLLNDIIDLLNPPPHITISVQQDMPIFKTKRIPLEQIFFNLIANAVKYNDKEAAWIKISVSENKNFYTFSVEDNGIGIKADYHERIFVIFQTLEARDKVEGTGIGLSIVKKSVEEAGGTIKVESEEGKGSKFIFTWPKEIGYKLKIAQPLAV